jgi:hypothetical protein
MPQRQLGELMTELGLISHEQLATVLEVQQQSNRPLGQIIVELGFASGAAVAHALAMQSGGALRTEYGFALGQPTVDEEGEVDATRTDLPKLRLAATALAPPGRDPAEPGAVEEQPVLELPSEPETAPEEAEEASPETPPVVEADHAELEQLRDEIERLKGALSEARAAAGEQERLRTEVEQLESALAEAQTAAGEQERLSTDVEKLEATLAEKQAEHEQNLARLREDRDELAAELQRLRVSLAEAQASASEHERRLAEEQERHASEREDLAERLADSGPAAEERDTLRTEVDQLQSTLTEAQAAAERLQEELAQAQEQLAASDSASEERDEFRIEIERLQHILAEVRRNSAAELRGVVEERDSLAAKLEEAQELLRQAERVRDSQIALEAERDRAVGELERLETVASEAQAEAEDRLRLLAEAQDRHQAELETLLAQRAVLEQELGSSIEQLAAATAAATEREAQLQLGPQRLLEALDGVRRLAAELASGSVEIPQEPAPDAPEAEPETDPVEIDYSLFVPGPGGYELVPQTGIPPQAGQRVELLYPDREEPVVYEVLRSGRTLPQGDVCVYLAQV